MLGLHEHVFAAVPRDDIISLPDYQSTNKTGASFETPCGRLLVKLCSLFIEIIFCYCYNSCNYVHLT